VIRARFGGNRRVPGLRREEVALLAGVSVDYYTRLERGNLNGARTPVLAIILLSYLMIVLDISIVITALPKLHQALGFSAAGLSWVQNAYTLAFGALLLLGARAGDLLGPCWAAATCSSPDWRCSPPPRSPSAWRRPPPGS
jgi:transcriptional regulator with XRE-family HTH domain